MPHSAPPDDSDTRSLPRVTFARPHPRFTSPTRFSAGRRTSSKKTSLNVCEPVISMMGRISMPGASMGQTKYEMPSCFGACGSVRAMRMPSCECWASDVQIFWPFTTHSSPSRSARVPSDARSDPEPGSLNSWHQISSPASSGNRYRSFWASLPPCTIVGPAQPMPIVFDGRRTPAADSSSSIRIWWIGSASSPHGVGQCGAT